MTKDEFHKLKVGDEVLYLFHVVKVTSITDERSLRIVYIDTGVSYDTAVTNERVLKVLPAFEKERCKNCGVPRYRCSC